MASASESKSHVAYCGGRACSVCHKCNDWYYNPEKYHDSDPYSLAYEHHVGPLIGPRYAWHRRIDATCGYHAYPHYVYYAAYHGDCPYTRDLCPPFYPSNRTHHNRYRTPAIHGPHICHCAIKE
jgi:hypothetical protein